jgi:pimeloyl-ACP methyl ester carboxylesterase
MFTAASDPRVRETALGRARQLPKKVGLELVSRMAAWDADVMEHALRGTKIPVTVLQSTRLDENRERISLQPGDSSPWLALVKELVPHAEIDILPGIGHFAMIEAADSVNRRLEAMLSNLADR